MSLEKHAKTDLLVIGAGVAGCLTAISLADQYDVTLIDQLSEPSDRIGESLAPAAQRILKQLGIFQNLNPRKKEQLYRKNIGMQSYWGSDRVQIEDHLNNPDGPVLCLNRKEFENHLRRTAMERGVRSIWPTRFYSSFYEQGRWLVTTTAGTPSPNNIKQQITARFVVDATGRPSRFARQVGVRRDHFDKLISCWSTMPDHGKNKMSTISACESGWWYSAVVPGHRRVLAYQTDADLIDRNQMRELEGFLLLAKEHQPVRRLLHESHDAIQFHGTVSANSTRLEHVAGNQWVAIGDAALSFDPLSSQGLFHAMASAMQFKELITGLDLIKDPTSRKMDQFRLLYTHQMDEVWERYLHHKRVYYGAERRWAACPFWRRRQERSDQ
ncbi:NAD(P)/FAD-dependent oxidoreductase [Membranicola marinus]|uniref:NAD(P)/FAD-dependent oxidoreductase n=1 Tax=Membranihabitans marinus TaxID=1227546 RepID=A0A953HUW4_9BACT|nr:NAD(P)/FAD-dependent oxidoreductase [Membranihabitans marinus]MBY5958641.1 NAD(P)/FAD-dependent oxidoreductase [Membranihabitans marinus]